MIDAPTAPAPLGPFTAYWLRQGLVGRASAIVYGRDVDCRAYLARVAPVFEGDDPDYFPIDEHRPTYATADAALAACRQARSTASTFIAALSGQLDWPFIRRVEDGGVL